MQVEHTVKSIRAKMTSIPRAADIIQTAYPGCGAVLLVKIAGKWHQVIIFIRALAVCNGFLAQISMAPSVARNKPTITHIAFIFDRKLNCARLLTATTTNAKIANFA